MLTQNPHRRYNPLTQEWVLVSPHRGNRPWNGKVENSKPVETKKYDPHCNLCVTNLRSNGQKNPNYTETFVFDNDFPAILPTENVSKNRDSLFTSESIDGVCRVICFSPDHSKSIARMSVEEIQKIFEVWQNQANELGKKYKYVQIFENKGEIMGCSNPHPHGQIWASNFIPTEIEKENASQLAYFQKNKSVLLVDYLNQELEKKERIILENSDWCVLVPFWAKWPYETMVLPKRKIARITDLTDSEKVSASQIFKEMLVIYDKLFETDFPYSMGWHFAPFDLDNSDYWQLHAHFYPPLLRSATVKKFMVGYEMLAEPQRDITPEQAALQLQQLI